MSKSYKTFKYLKLDSPWITPVFPSLNHNTFVELNYYIT